LVQNSRLSTANYINYELAKKLKDAGFPQAIITPRGTLEVDKNENYVKTPALEELIAECGDGFDELRRHSEGYDATGNKDGFAYETGIVKSPKEAVANLYLLLHGPKA
jgi:hypothetical protein